MSITVTNEQSALRVDEAKLQDAAAAVLSDAGYEDAQLSVVVVDDPTIHKLNRQFLNHDYPTDVLSFLLGEPPQKFEGEVIVSSETAAREADAYGWAAHDELLLYVLHGVLHLVGYNDKSEEDALRMRAAERRYLLRAGVQPPAAAEGGAT